MRHVLVNGVQVLRDGEHTMLNREGLLEAWESKVTIVYAILRGILGYKDGRGGEV